MSKLRESARNQDCMIRLPGVCNFNPETTVLAHYRLVGLTRGYKPNDMFGAFACSKCHNAVDNSHGLSSADEAEQNQWFLEGVLRTQQWWIDNGLVVVK